MIVWKVYGLVYVIEIVTMAINCMISYKGSSKVIDLFINCSHINPFDYFSHTIFIVNLSVSLHVTLVSQSTIWMIFLSHSLSFYNQFVCEKKYDFNFIKMSLERRLRSKDDDRSVISHKIEHVRTLYIIVNKFLPKRKIDRCIWRTFVSGLLIQSSYLGQDTWWKSTLWNIMIFSLKIF